MITPRSIRPLFAIALAALLVACKPAADSAPTAAAAPEAAPAAAEATPAETKPAASEAATPAPVDNAPPVSHTPTGPVPVAGTDYQLIPNGQPFAPHPGQVEVLEAFNYVCPACAAFEPLFKPWAKSLPADVSMVHLPVQFGADANSPWHDYARAYYTAEAMGVADKTHQALYDEIHVKKALKGERGRDGMDAIAAFYGRNGVDVAQFKSTSTSFSVESKLGKAMQYMKAVKIDGTPSLIINGKYRITGGKDRADQLRIADHLIDAERKAGAAK